MHPSRHYTFALLTALVSSGYALLVLLVIPGSAADEAGGGPGMTSGSRPWQPWCTNPWRGVSSADPPEGGFGMSTVSVAAERLQGFDEDAWDDLLNYIEERRVIPIIGPDLLRVQTDTGLRPLYEWLAEKLAARLSVDVAELPQPLTLNDVMCAWLGQRGRREEAYTRLRSIMREVQFEPPPVLRQLAQITDFDLFVTTTFDPLLETAVNLER